MLMPTNLSHVIKVVNEITIKSSVRLEKRETLMISVNISNITGEDDVKKSN